MLWKKETDRKDAMYVDLLASPSIDRLYEDYQRVNNIKKNLYPYDFQKSASKATKYRLKGNDMFAEKKWVNATEFYNKSMCFAEYGSEQMALAYANRSSCFFNMKMYTKCLIDIENAKQNKYPPEKMGKLDERISMCMSTMEKEMD